MICALWLKWVPVQWLSCNRAVICFDEANFVVTEATTDCCFSCKLRILMHYSIKFSIGLEYVATSSSLQLVSWGIPYVNDSDKLQLNVYETTKSHKSLLPYMFEVLMITWCTDLGCVAFLRFELRFCVFGRRDIKSSWIRYGTRTQPRQAFLLI